MDRMRVMHFADRLFNQIDEPVWRIRAISHSHAVAALAALLARRRGLNVELAAICGYLHDLAAFERCSYEEHAFLGAERAVEVLRELGETDEKILACVRSAVLRHDDLDKTDEQMDEVLKDADLLDNAQMKARKDLRPVEAERLQRVYIELGIRQEL